VVLNKMTCGRRKAIQEALRKAGLRQRQRLTDAPDSFAATAGEPHDQ
jgi:hypothetical protein